MQICVGALLAKKNKILLGQRSANRALYPDVWDVFGGHIEPHEQPEQALVRELNEELAIMSVAWRYLDTIVVELATSALECRFYVVTEWKGTPVNRQLEEHAAIRWFDLESAVRLTLAHPTYPDLFRRCLDVGV